MERKKHQKLPINNAFYDDLSEKWFQSEDHPVALLRAENHLRNPWLNQVIKEKLDKPCKILDLGCGAGFLSHYLAGQGHEVTGIDLSQKSLETAQKHDPTHRVKYVRSSADEVPFEDESFDVVSAMDLLEHVHNPASVIKEASRLLKKNGLFFFHTFNRNLFSYLMVIKGVDWCFYQPPANMHVYPLFIKPDELKEMCVSHQLAVEQLLGVRPDFKSKGFWKLLFQRKVSQNFRFVFTSSLKTGYSGYAVKH